MDNETIKVKAKENIKHNYFKTVIVTFIVYCVLNGGIIYSTKNILDISVYDTNTKEIIKDIDIDEALEKSDKVIEYENNLSNKYKYGIMSYLVNETINTRSLTFTIINAINNIIFNSKLTIGILIIISSLVLIIFRVLFIDILDIGLKRYYLNKKNKIEDILYPYKSKKIFHLSYILFLKNIYLIYYLLTIVKFIPKYYEYKLIPYILAENPHLSKDEVFKLANNLSDNNKLNMFKLDLSLIGFYMLKIITFNLSSIFYFNIYKESIYKEIYLTLKKEKNIDIKYLVIKKDKINYHKEYSLSSYILLFFTFSILGFIWEVLYKFIKHGVLVNRGVMHLFWLPIYGFGGLLILILLKRFKDKPSKVFMYATILCGVIEYLTSFVLEKVWHLRYWDYHGFFLNINGRVCLEGLLFFGLAGYGFTYLLAPLFDNLFNKLNKKIKYSLCLILILLFSGDLIYTIYEPNQGSGISKEVIVDE